MNQEIDENLRRVYSEAVEQEVPDRFTKLLAQLRQQGEDSSGGQQFGDSNGDRDNR